MVLLGSGGARPKKWESTMMGGAMRIRRRGVLASIRNLVLAVAILMGTLLQTGCYQASLLAEVAILSDPSGHALYILMPQILTLAFMELTTPVPFSILP